MASSNYPNANETSLVRIVQGIRDLYQGRSNATGSFTLTEDVTETVVLAANCGLGSVISLMPQTANAAAALGTTYIDPDDIVRGQFTVTHANNSQTDRTFSYSIQG